MRVLQPDRSLSRVAVTAVTAVTAVAVLAAGCGGGKKVVDTQTLGRYCELSRQLDEAAVGSHAASAPGTYDGDPPAIAKLVDQVGPTLPELKASAPKKIRSEVTTTVDALRKARTGDLTGLRSPEVGSAARNMSAFRSRSCSGTGTNGDG